MIRNYFVIIQKGSTLYRLGKSLHRRGFHDASGSVRKYKSLLELSRFPSPQPLDNCRTKLCLLHPSSQNCKVFLRGEMKDECLCSCVGHDQVPWSRFTRNEMPNGFPVLSTGCTQHLCLQKSLDHKNSHTVQPFPDPSLALSSISAVVI